GRMLQNIILLAVVLAPVSCRSKPPYEGKSAAELEEMLKDEDPKVQAQGAYGICRDSAKARQLVPALTVALKSRNVLVGEDAARALGGAGPVAADAVPALTALLRDPAWKVRREAALALGQVGPGAAAARRALQKAAGDSNKVVREAAREALQKMGGK